jgi:hypothetical protein
MLNAVDHLLQLERYGREECKIMTEPKIQNPKSKIQNPHTDLLGQPLTEPEQELMAVYGALKALAARADLPPCAARNVRQALSALWQATNDLDLQFEQLYDLAV